MTFKKFLRVVLIYQLRALVFWPCGADKERGFYFVMRNTFLLILNFYYSQRISKHYHGVWTPHLSHLDILDFHNRMGGVSQCISFQFILDSLKKNITDVHQTSCPPIHLQPCSLWMSEHTGGFPRLWSRPRTCLGPTDPSPGVSGFLAHSGAKGPIVQAVWTWSCHL